MDKLSHKTELTVTIVIIIMYKRPTHTHTHMHAYISIYCTLLVHVFSIRVVYCSSIDFNKMCLEKENNNFIQVNCKSFIINRQ